VRREQYVGPWLPEPLLKEQAQEIGGQADLEDSLSMAFLVLLESLTPVERAVFLLREVFAYEYAEIASLVGKSEANCRQISRRGRQSLAARRPLVVEGDRAYFRTWDTAWKLRRIRNNPEVEFTPSTAVAGLRCRR
jgi:RNA polymerase sigma-70 factor (ECF subfamily)